MRALGLEGKAGGKTLADAATRRLWSLESEALCAEARRRTRLEHFGDPPLQPALSALTQSLEKEANLHPLGRFLMRSHLLGLLETRLRLAELWGRQSEALGNSPISRPIFITGMPRSGSTFLHELMAEDPDNRVPRVWEVMFPIAPRHAGHGGRDSRVRKTASCLWWYRRLAPRADAVHPLRAWTPHECVAIHSHTLLSEEFVTTCHVPGYEAFLRASNLGPAYTFQRRFLQHLQSGGPLKRWVLKSPDHVFGLEAIFSVFPDAQIIQTHRNPLEVLRSLNQLNDVVRRVFARPADQAQSDAREAQVLEANMERFIRFRDHHPSLADRFIDVNYPELVAAPLETARRIYEKLEIPFTQAAATRMHRLAAGRGRYRKPPMDSAARPRLDAAAEARRFERYCARFGVSC
jgi:hypothetical protein